MKTSQVDISKKGDWDDVLVFSPYNGVLNKGLMLLIFCWNTSDMIGLYQAEDANLEAWLKSTTMLLVSILYVASLAIPQRRGRYLAWLLMCLCCLFSLVLRVLHWGIWGLL